MKRSVIWFGLWIPISACANTPGDPPPAQENPVVGSCPPCSDNQLCVNGACEDLQSNDTSNTCGPATCATGCCSDGHCVSGTSVNGCGKGGGLCDVCASGETCDLDQHRCSTAACDETSCPNGCCDGSTCRQTPDDSHCGSGGAACSACGASEKCELQGSSYECVAQAGPTYEITLLSASIASNKPDGSNWDTTKDAGCVSCLIGCCPPDVYVSDVSQFAGFSLPKIVASNTTSPSWNVIIGKKDGKSLIGATVNIVLKDEDPSVLTDDAIGSCTTTVSAADLGSGMLTLNPSRGCTGSVQSLVFSLSAN